MTGAYYNENDPKAVAWLRELVKEGVIAPGEVDDRSILDVTPAELAGFTQCHFFAGIGVWSYALRLAGWPDDRPVWTGSCPCQPFSAAGKGDGFADERHLWPYWFHLIEQCRPANLYGEQVASKNADPWVDLVQDDLEALGYAFGAVPFPAAGIGAPHIRDRTYWLADATGSRRTRPEDRRPDSSHAGEGRGGSQSQRGMPAGNVAHSESRGRGIIGRETEPGRVRHDDGSERAGRLADTDDTERRSERAGGHHGGGQDAGRAEGAGDTEGRDSVRRMAYADGGHASAEREQRSREHGQQPQDGGPGVALGDTISTGLEGYAGHGDYPRGRSFALGSVAASGAVGGFWRDAEVVYCRDGKLRPVEPGTFPLAHGTPARVGRLRGYGNAIVAEAAAEFIGASLALSPGGDDHG